MSGAGKVGKKDGLIDWSDKNLADDPDFKDLDINIFTDPSLTSEKLVALAKGKATSSKVGTNPPVTKTKPPPPTPHAKSKAKVHQERMAEVHRHTYLKRGSKGPERLWG